MSDFRSRVLGTIIGILSRGSSPKREPVAFLYGHVAKEGETPTQIINGVGYVGMVAPKLPVVEGMEFVAMCDIGLTIHTATFFNTYEFGIDPSTWVYVVKVPEENRKFLWQASGSNTDWSEGSPTEYNIRAINVGWANFDIINDSYKINLPATDPIPVYRQVGFKYGDSEVLPDIYSVYTPELQEQYPYAVLGYGEYSADIYGGGKVANLICSSEPLVKYPDEQWLSALGDVRIYHFNSNEALWGEYFGFDEPYPALNKWVLTKEEHFDSRTECIVFPAKAIPAWSNHDVVSGVTAEPLNKTYLVASDPIPVYE